MPYLLNTRRNKSRRGQLVAVMEAAARARSSAGTERDQGAVVGAYAV